MRRKILAAMLLASAMLSPAAAQDLGQAIHRDMPDLMALYRDLHANPELSMQETRSAARMAAEARSAGFTVTTGVGGTGVVAVMENGPGPVLMLRADMDALPVEEQTGLPFASHARGTTREGAPTAIMHACGHDTHMATWVGTARRMAAMRAQWSGTLVMIAQPGEETSQGAKAMLDDGLFTRFPHPTHAIAFHDSASLPAGIVGYSVGPALANVDSVDMIVHGVGGHGAFPHTTRDPIVLASRIVVTLQTLVSRETNPLDPAVVTVGSFHAGSKHNIISDEARLQLTVRSYTPAVRAHLIEGIGRIARGEAIAADVPANLMPEVIVREAEATPATVNTDALTQSTVALFRQHFGDARIQSVPPSMGGEDFSRYHLADPRIESLIFWVGGVPQARWDAAHGDVAHLPSLHSPLWAPDAEAVIGTATEAMTVAAMGVLGRR